MKRLLGILMICLVCLFAFASCNNKPDEPTPTPEQPEHIHEFGEWEAEKNPTCTEDGISARYCSCGEKQEKPVPAPGHNEQTIPAVSETCTKSGLTEGIRCSVCGEIIVAQEPIPPHGHNLSTTTEKDENCNVFDVTTCSYQCGYLDKVFINVDHSFGDWEFVSEKDNTTISCGVDKLYARTCSACGNVEEKTEFAEGHEWIYYNYPAVVECQYMGCYDLLLKECDRCGEKDIRRGEGHIESDWITQTEATCTTDGLKYIKCLRGEDILAEEVIPATGHDWKDATCLDPKTCLTCGATDGEAKGHTPSAAATCTTAQTCTECHAVIIPALGHNYVNDVCDRCGEKLVLAAGLYDANDNLVASWDTLVNTYGMDVSKDYTKNNYNTSPSSPYYVLKNNTELSSGVKIVIPGSVTSIGDSAFYDCDSLTSIKIPDSVTGIGSYAFRYCRSLTSITIGNGVTSIGDWAFSDCDSLTSITIPDSVTRIGSCAFSRCISLTSIEVDENNQYYKSIDGNLYSKDGKRLKQYAIGKTATSFVIPSGVTSIGPYAFSSCKSLTSITIPSSVTSIGGSAFSSCKSLTRITIPDSVTSISNHAFSYCDSLTRIKIPSKVSKISYDAFRNCKKLKIIVADPSNIKKWDKKWNPDNLEVYSGGVRLRKNIFGVYK